MKYSSTEVQTSAFADAWAELHAASADVSPTLRGLFEEVSRQAEKRVLSEYGAPVEHEGAVRFLMSERNAAEANALLARIQAGAVAEARARDVLLKAMVEAKPITGNRHERRASAAKNRRKR